MFETGARLSIPALEARADALGDHLQVGMQAMEDTFCNWQKSPVVFTLSRLTKPSLVQAKRRCNRFN